MSDLASRVSDLVSSYFQGVRNYFQGPVAAVITPWSYYKAGRARQDTRRSSRCEIAVQHKSRSFRGDTLVRHGALGVIPTPQPQRGTPFAPRGPEARSPTSTNSGLNHTRLISLSTLRRKGRPSTAQDSLLPAAGPALPDVGGVSTRELDSVGQPRLPEGRFASNTSAVAEGSRNFLSALRFREGRENEDLSVQQFAQGDKCAVGRHDRDASLDLQGNDCVAWPLAPPTRWNGRRQDRHRDPSTEGGRKVVGANLRWMR